MANIIVPVNAESHFGVEELFFSRTNHAANILSGNAVFRRVSKHSWDHMQGKAHSIIRHPDMPRGVFYLFWQFLNANKPVGAYVKNMAADGSYYWVFALASPIGDDFLSVRLKPTTATQKAVEGFYQQWKAREVSAKLSPQASFELIVKDLAAAGITDYGHFMSRSLLEELVSRFEKLPNGASGQQVNALEMAQETLLGLNECQKLQLNFQKVLQSYRKVKYLPINIQLESSGVEDESMVLSCVSEKFAGSFAEFGKGIQSLMDSGMESIKVIHETSFLVAASILQKEMEHDFLIESKKSSDESLSVDLECLRTVSSSYIQNGVDSLGNMSFALHQLSGRASELETLVNSLEFIRMVGKIEASRMSVETGARFLNLLEEINKTLLDLRATLELVVKSQGVLGSSVRRIASSLMAT